MINVNHFLLSIVLIKKNVGMKTMTIKITNEGVTIIF